MKVEFKSYGKTGRVHFAVFDLGSDYENGIAALKYAHDTNSAIVEVTK